MDRALPAKTNVHLYDSPGTYLCCCWLVCPQLLPGASESSSLVLVGNSSLALAGSSGGPNGDFLSIQ